MADSVVTREQQRAAAELLKRRRARESLLGFVEAIEVPGDPANGDDEGDAADATYLPAPVGEQMALHHRVLCEALQRTMDKPYGRLMVFMPPGAAKSTYCSVVAPTWEMGRKPGSRIILAMHSGEIAKKQGRRARSIVRQRAYREIFQTSLSKETSAAEMWIMENAAEYMAAGIRSGIAGNRASGLIVDDPIRGRKDADSDLIRRDTLVAWQDDLQTRLLPRAWVVLIQTRWHPGDLAGMLLPETYAGESGPVLCRDGMVWEVLNIPAEAEHADDPLGRQLGEMLWPEWFDAEHWKAPRKVPRTWAALYQQRPTLGEGASFKRAWFEENRYDPKRSLPAMNRFGFSDYATIDAEDADDPDFTSHGMFGVASDGHVYVLDWYTKQVDTEVGIMALLRLAKKNRVVRGFGEVGVIRRAIEPAFKRLKRKSGIRYEVTYLPHVGNKSVSGLSFQALAEAGLIHFPLGCEWADKVIDQLCAFPNVTHDDDCDVCFLMGRAVDNMAFGREPTEEQVDEGIKPFSWRWLCYGTERGNEPEKRGERVM